MALVVERVRLDRDVENARQYAAAEQRLGRPLHPAETRIDIVGSLAILEHGKARLHLAIVAEQRRVAKAAFHGHTDLQMRVTDEMVAALNWLHEQGMREAVKELDRAGIRTGPNSAARRTYADPRRAISRLMTKLGSWLPGITVRSRRRAIEASLAGEGQAAVMRAGARVPGALDAASRLVSSAFYGGMGDVFSANQDLVGGWIYSAVLDGGTCDVCEAADGTEYATWDEVEQDLPGGGPNPDCDGDGRCRCRAVPAGPNVEVAAEPTDEPQAPLDSTEVTGDEAAALAGEVASWPGADLATEALDEASIEGRVVLATRTADGTLAAVASYAVETKDLSMADGTLLRRPIKLTRIAANDAVPGAGTDLLAQIASRAVVEQRDLYVVPSLRAQGFYERLGFTKDGGTYYLHGDKLDQFVLDHTLPADVPDLAPTTNPLLPPPPFPGSTVVDEATALGPDELKAAYSDWAESLTKDEKNAIAGYVSFGGHAINTYLRMDAAGQGAEIASRLKAYMPSIKALDGALAKGELPQATTFWRGLTDGRVVFGGPVDSGLVGKEVTDHAFMSTTLGEQFARLGNGNVPIDTVLKIDVPAGSRGAYLDAAGKEVIGESQQEFLLPRDTTLRIKDVTEDGGQKIVHAEVVTPAQIDVNVAPVKIETVSSPVNEEDLAVLPDTAGGDMIGGILSDDAKSEGDRQVLVARNTVGDIVGAIDMDVTDTGVFVDGIGSTQSGVGTQLMRQAMDEAQVRGVPVTLRSVPDATGFYEKLGFKRDGDVYKWTPPAGRKLPPQILQELIKARVEPGIVDQATVADLTNPGVPSGAYGTRVKQMDHLFWRPPYSTASEEKPAAFRKEVMAYDLYRSPQAYAQFQSGLRAGKLSTPVVTKEAIQEETRRGLGAAVDSFMSYFDLKEGATIRKYVTQIDKLIDASPPLDREQTFFRGAQRIDRIWGPDGPTVGESYVEKGYMSVSADPGVAELFSEGMSTGVPDILVGAQDPAVMELRVPKGAKGMWGRATGRDQIYEFTLPRGTKIVVDKVDSIHLPEADNGRPAFTEKYVYAHVELPTVPDAVIPASRAAAPATDATLPRELPQSIKDELAKARAEPGIVDLVTTVTTSDPLEALEALNRGERVVLEHPDEIATVLEDMGKAADDAEKASAAGVPPVENNFDLGRLSVKGTNLFTQDSKGIPRIAMPQLKGHPLPGSLADHLPRDVRGEVDIAPLFYQRLRTTGVKIDQVDMKVSHLRATQNELDGEKVAGIMRFLEGGGKIEGAIPVSKDGYIVDGHHRWAAEIGLDYRKGLDAGKTMQVDRIDEDILTILNQANAFAKEYGIPQAAVFDNAQVQAVAADSARLVDEIKATGADKAVEAAGYKITLPPISEVEVRRAVEGLRQAYPLASREEIAQDLELMLIEPPEGGTLGPAAPHDILKDAFVAAEWDVLAVESEFAASKIVLERTGTGFKLTLRLEGGSKVEVEKNFNDALHAAHNVAVANGQTGNNIPIPAVQAAAGSLSLSEFLQEPAQASGVIYFGLQTDQGKRTGQLSGCMRAFTLHGREIIQVCGPDGTWGSVPPPPVTSINGVEPISQATAAAVFLQIKESSRALYSARHAKVKR